MYTTDRQKQEGYIDIHTHILPGVDDGAASMEQSVRMACAAAMDGTAHIILTPHQKRAFPIRDAAGSSSEWGWRILSPRTPMEKKNDGRSSAGAPDGWKKAWEGPK